MVYVVNRNYAEDIKEIETTDEDAFHVYAEGVKISKFGPAVFCFNTKEAAKDFANQILGEQIAAHEERLERIKDKKNQLAKVK